MAVLNAGEGMGILGGGGWGVIDFIFTQKGGGEYFTLGGTEVDYFSDLNFQSFPLILPHIAYFI